MSRMSRWVFALALLPVAACTHTPPAPPADAPAPKPTLSDADQNFVQTAAASDAFEVQSSQLAADHARSAAVKQFASKMVEAHTGTTQQLTQIVTGKGLPAPQAQLSAEQQQILTKLQGEKGWKFDHDYTQDQVTGHQAAVELFQQESNSGQDTDLKTFAQQTLPTIQSHLSDAEALSGPHHGRARSWHHHHATHDAAPADTTTGQ